MRAPCAHHWHVWTWIVLALALSVSARAEPDSGEYQVYPLQYKGAAEVERMLSEMLSDLGPTTQVVADLRRNQILVRGPEKAHQIARQLIDSVDRPPGTNTSSRPLVKAYPYPRSGLAEAADRLGARYRGVANVRIATDPQTSQLLVLAPPEIHAMVARDLASVEVEGTAARPGERPPAVQIPAEQSVRLLYSRVEQVEPQLRTLLGSRLEPLPNHPPGRPDFLFVDAAGGRVELTVDRKGNGLVIVGSQPLVRQFVLLIHALDALQSPRQEPDKTVRIVPVHRADPAKIRQAVDAYRTGGSGSRAYPGAPGQPAAAPARAPAKDDMGRSGRANPGGIDLVQYTVQVDGTVAAPSGAGAEPKPGVAPSGAAPAQRIPTTEEELKTQEKEREALRELGENVEIETLPDLDVIILRGRERDIDEVSRIIAEIERLSAITEPQVEIYTLQHVSGEAVIQIFDLVAEDLAGGRQGSVHITALIKPNALLLIGWGEALEAIKELIAKLDQPVAPETQLRVFPLRHAAASSAATTVEQFFGSPQGLGPRVHAEADARTNSLIVRAAPRDMEEVALLVSRLDQGTSEAVNQARVFKLNNSLAGDVASTLQSAIEAARGGGERKSAVLELLTADVQGQRILKSGILSDVEITPDPHTNTLIVSAPTESMGLLAALIQELDSPTAVAQIKVFRVVNGDANSLITMLRTLLPAQAGVAGPQLAGAEGETTLVPVRFAVDARTNSIIATGSEGDLAIIEALLLRLDSEEIEERKNTVYRLKNSPAADVARAIDQFLERERAVELALTGESPFRQVEREVVVVPETVTNSLIISATPRFYDEIEKLVEQLDKAPAQVMIQVLIAEVQLNDFDEFGVELGIQDSLLFDRSLLGDLVTLTESTLVPGVGTVQNEKIIAASLDPGFNFNGTQPLGNTGSEQALAGAHHAAGQALSNFAVGRLNNELGYGGLVLSASSESISALIRALQERRRLDVLSRPQIMTLDNQPAYIQVGKAVPRIVGTRFDGQTQVNQIDLEPTGLIMGVTPRVSPEGTVVMEIDAEKSELGTEAEGIPVSVVQGQIIRQPSINITLAQTTVSAASGETVVLGGLITKRDSTINRRVPWLYRVPVLGNLFRYDNDTGQRSELLIILTPHVIQDAQEAERIKEVEAARMSWCLADVNAIQGPTGIYDDRDSSAWQGQGEVIYPDTNPRGLKPGEFVPKEVRPESLELSPPVQNSPPPAPKQGPRTLTPPELWDSLPEKDFPGKPKAPAHEPTPAEGPRPAPDQPPPAPNVEPASWTSTTAPEAAGRLYYPQERTPD